METNVGFHVSISALADGGTRWLAGPLQHLSNGFRETWPFVRIPVSFSKVGICLTRRGSVKSIEQREEFRVERQGVGLNERKRIVRLRLNVHAYNLKSGATVADACAARAAEKV